MTIKNSRASRNVLGWVENKQKSVPRVNFAFQTPAGEVEFKRKVLPSYDSLAEGNNHRFQ